MNQDSNTPHAVVAEGLGKRYGEQWALRDFDLTVPTGSVLGLLGHNGAGKTTAIRILTTLASPTAGRATVAGHDVVTEATEVREQIGLTSQAATVDGLLSGAANLEMIGRLYHLPRKVAKARGDRAAGRARPRGRRPTAWSRTTAAGCAAGSTSPPASSPRPRSSSSTSRPPASTRKAATSSGTCSASLVGGGTTVILTTQYLEEADQLADDVDPARPRRRSSPAAPRPG